MQLTPLLWKHLLARYSALFFVEKKVKVSIMPNMYKYRPQLECEAFTEDILSKDSA